MSHQRDAVFTNAWCRSIVLLSSSKGPCTTNAITVRHERQRPLHSNNSRYPKKNIHEITVNEPKNTDEEVDIQYPSAEIDGYDEITSEEMEEVEKQFISVLNLDHEPLDESEYNSISAIRNGYANDESDIFDEEGFQQIMAYQDVIPYCHECASYDHLTSNCPKTMTESSKM